MIKFEDMIETRMIKDTSDERGYSEGYYNNRVPISGYYLKAKKGSLLEGLEIFAKSKFKLEKDAENYVQEARIETYLALNEYYNNVGSESDSDEDVSAWVYKVVTNRLKNLSMSLKSSVSYYDWEKGEYIINNIIYLDKRNDDDSEEHLDVIMEIDNIKRAENSKSEFKIWLENNKEKCLTKKQIEYLNGEVVINDTSNENKIRKNIISRIDKNFHDDYICENRCYRLAKKLEEIQSLSKLYDEDEIATELIRLDSLEKEYVIDDILYENLDFEDCRNLTRVLNGETIEDLKFFTRIMQILIKKEKNILDKLKNYHFNLYI